MWERASNWNSKFSNGFCFGCWKFLNVWTKYWNRFQGIYLCTNWAIFRMLKTLWKIDITFYGPLNGWVSHWQCDILTLKMFDRGVNTNFNLRAWYILKYYTFLLIFIHMRVIWTPKITKLITWQFQTWKFSNFMPFLCNPCYHQQNILLGGKWWFFPRLDCDVSYEFMLTCGLFMHEMCKLISPWIQCNNLIPLLA